jgi:hypothetical protein
MHGKGYIKEKLIGSNVTGLIKKAACPILVINEKVKFKSIKKILLACDYEDISDKSILDPLRELASAFKSKIFVFNVINPLLPNTPDIEKSSNGVRIDNWLDDINHTFNSVENEDFIDGINTFAITHKADMIVMIPHKHSVM